MKKFAQILLVGTGTLFLQACDSEEPNGKSAFDYLKTEDKPPEISAAVAPNVRPGAASLDQLANRYFETLGKKDKVGFRALWVTNAVLKESLVQNNVHESQHRDYIRESFKQQDLSIRRHLEKMDDPKPDIEIVSTEADRMAPGGKSCSGIKVTIRDKANGRERNAMIPQEAVQVDGRWYFYERP